MANFATVKYEMTVGSQIRKKRKLLEWSLRKLGERADVSESFLSQVENGRDLAVSTFLKISKALGCPSKELLGR